MKVLRPLALVVAVLFAAPAVAADTVTPPDGYPERVLGKEDAPVTIYEYSSLTCPHCADFHAETLPDLKKTYFDTGRAKLVFRDFPLDPLALAGALIARCAPEAVYFKLLDILFAKQGDWARAANPVEALKQYGRLSGMSDAALDACLKNEDLLKAIQSVQTQANERLGIDSTPSFVINGEVVAGARSAEAFGTLIEQAEKKAR